MESADVGHRRTFESPFPEVKQFISQALTCEDLPEHKGYRLSDENLTTEAVYSFCEAKDPQTRALGMQLVERVPRLRDVDELFRLTESPDRKVRNFVIRSMWEVFRSRGITDQWKPVIPEKATTGKKKNQLNRSSMSGMEQELPICPTTCRLLPMN